MVFSLLSLIKANQEIPEINDFSELKKRYLKQKVIKLNNLFERVKIWQNLVRLDHEVDQSLKHMNGIEYLGRDYIDCVNYAIGSNEFNDVLPGILEHDGNPEEGDIIIYGNSIDQPIHMGVYQSDGKIISKWGDSGPLMKHDLKKIVLGHGKYALFSTFKGNLE